MDQEHGVRTTDLRIRSLYLGLLDTLRTAHGSSWSDGMTGMENQPIILGSWFPGESKKVWRNQETKRYKEIEKGEQESERKAKSTEN
uniref:Uncharacterized protein n=1 Tax=Timema poppense TaxID=170557 RepID=A0A7R9CQU6_TIMPO|nr:unnamed protein product [Timema poppensis]